MSEKKQPYHIAPAPEQAGQRVLLPDCDCSGMYCTGHQSLRCVKEFRARPDRAGKFFSRCRDCQNKSVRRRLYGREGYSKRRSSPDPEELAAIVHVSGCQGCEGAWCTGHDSFACRQAFSFSRGGMYHLKSRCKDCLNKEYRIRRYGDDIRLLIASDGRRLAPPTKEEINGVEHVSHCGGCEGKWCSTHRKYLCVEKFDPRFWKGRKGGEYTRNQCRECIKRKGRDKKYGLAEGQYYAMLEIQNGVCAICGRPPRSDRNGNASELFVDHIDEPWHIRGLLCRDCNSGIHILDNPKLLKSAVAYFTQYEGYNPLDLVNRGE